MINDHPILSLEMTTYIFDDAYAQIWQKKAAFAVMADGDPCIIC